MVVVNCSGWCWMIVVGFGGTLGLAVMGKGREVVVDKTVVEIGLKQ